MAAHVLTLLRVLVLVHVFVLVRTYVCLFLFSFALAFWQNCGRLLKEPDALALATTGKVISRKAAKD